MRRLVRSDLFGGWEVLGRGERPQSLVDAGMPGTGRRRLPGCRGVVGWRGLLPCHGMLTCRSLLACHGLLRVGHGAPVRLAGACFAKVLLATTFLVAALLVPALLVATFFAGG